MRFRGELYWPVHRRRRGTPAGPVVLLDNFTGTGTLTAHRPDVAPRGSAWEIISGTWGELDGAGHLPYISGNWGAALINVGISDFELTWRSKHLAGGNGVFSSGVFLRANETNSDKYGFGTYYNATEMTHYFMGSLVRSAYSRLVAPIALDLPLGEYMGWKLSVKGTQARIRDEYDDLIGYCLNLAKTSNTYVGVGCQQAGGNWDWIQVSSLFSSEWKSVSIMGDSLSDNYDDWPGYFAVKHNDGWCEVKNHAVTGATVASGMDAQTVQCIADDAAFTIVALGTNDGAGSAATQAEYLENLMELWNATGKPIYCMGVLPKSPGDADRISMNGYIEAAVVAALGNGATVEYWSTDGWIDPLTDTTDGLHLTADAQWNVALAVQEKFNGVPT